jgi:hypothetical protein
LRANSERPAKFLARGATLAATISEGEFAIYGEHPSMVCRVYGGQVKILMGFPESGMRLIKAGVAHARHQNNAHSLAWALGVFRFGDCHFATHFPARHARAARSCFLSDIQTRRLPHSRRRVVRNALRKDEQRLAFAVDGTPGVQVPAVETPP